MNQDLLSPHRALVHVMVIVSAADSEMTDEELQRIGLLVRTLPVFADFDVDDLVPAAEACANMLAQPNGLERVLDIIVASLPAKLAETAYAIACDVAAADLEVEQAELSVLELLRHRLQVERLAAAAIERGARARHMTL